MTQRSGSLPLQPQPGGDRRQRGKLRAHACLLYKFPTTGKVETWPVAGGDKRLDEDLAKRTVCNTVDTLIYLAEQGLGIACLPDFAVREALERRRHQPVLGDHCRHSGNLKILWPSSKHLTPRLRAFIDIMSVRLFSA